METQKGPTAVLVKGDYMGFHVCLRECMFQKLWFITINFGLGFRVKGLGFRVKDLGV